MRAAIYARYSSDLQSASSIDDQLRLCRERAKAIGADVAEVYTDAAISGAHLATRPAMRSLMADAKAGRFDILIAEALDRLSRDQEDIAGIYKRLSHIGIKILTLSEGEVSELHIGLKGTMNALYLKDMAAKVRRGQRGRIEIGRAAGGLTYGYKVVPELSERGELLRGKRVIDPDQAAVILRIVERYVAGQGPRQIAYDLNADGIPAPRGGTWSASTIVGNRSRATGILHNELYIGCITYNRQSFRKDPDTGKRLPVVNAPDQWIRSEVPNLRIIPQDLWERAQLLKKRMGNHPPHMRRRPRHLLSGLLKCGCCGATMTVVTQDRVGCAGYRESRTCANNRTVKLGKVEAKVLAAVQSEMLKPDVIAEFISSYRQAWEEDRSDAKRQRARAERTLRDLEGKIGRIVAAVADGAAGSKAMLAHLADLEARQAQAAQELAETPDPTVVHLHPDLADRYRERVAALAACMNDPGDRTEAIATMTDLIDRVLLWPTDDGEYDAEIFGRLAKIMQPAGPRSAAVRNSTVVMVAPDGLVRQSTSGLWSVRVKL